MSVIKSKSAMKSAASKSKPVAPSGKNSPARPKKRAYARFDARLTQEQKDLFEEARILIGSKSLSEFIISSTLEAANSIIEKHHQILSSEKDRAIFFDALINPPKPNEALVKAAKRYRKQVAAK